MEHGVHEIKVNGYSLKITLRDVITFVSTTLAIVGLYFVSTNRINKNERSIEDLYTKHSEAVAYASEMDKNGTHRSHEMDSGQQQMLDQHSKDISEINRTLRDLAPKVDKIDTNVLWLMAKQLEHK